MWYEDLDEPNADEPSRGDKFGYISDQDQVRFQPRSVYEFHEYQQLNLAGVNLEPVKRQFGAPRDKLSTHLSVSTRLMYSVTGCKSSDPLSTMNPLVQILYLPFVLFQYNCLFCLSDHLSTRGKGANLIFIAKRATDIVSSAKFSLELLQLVIENGHWQITVRNYSASNQSSWIFLRLNNRLQRVLH